MPAPYRVGEERVTSLGVLGNQPWDPPFLGHELAQPVMPRGPVEPEQILTVLMQDVEEVRRQWY